MRGQEVVSRTSTRMRLPSSFCWWRNCWSVVTSAWYPAASAGAGRIPDSTVALIVGSDATVATVVQLGPMTLPEVTTTVLKRQLFARESGLLGLGVLRHSSESVWKLTLRELATAMNAYGAAQISPPDRAALADLMRRFPDLSRNKDADRDR